MPLYTWRSRPFLPYSFFEHNLKPGLPNTPLLRLKIGVSHTGIGGLSHTEGAGVTQTVLEVQEAR